MKEETLVKLLKENGFFAHPMFPGLYVKACGENDVGYWVAENGDVDMVQADDVGGWVVIKGANLADFCETPAESGKLKFADGKGWKKTGKKVLL